MTPMTGFWGIGYLYIPPPVIHLFFKSIWHVWHVAWGIKLPLKTESLTMKPFMPDKKTSGMKSPKTAKNDRLMPDMPDKIKVLKKYGFIVILLSFHGV
jgi:hypothetical protein